MAPPGVVYLCVTLPRLLVPATGVYLGTTIANHAFGIQIPWSLRITACVFSLPTAFYLSLLWTDIKNKRRADALGAELPPMMQVEPYSSTLRVVDGV
jgi:hypothetical protein